MEAFAIILIIGMFFGVIIAISQKSNENSKKEYKSNSYGEFEDEDFEKECEDEDQIDELYNRKMYLCERICESAVDASEQFLSYLKEDSYLYGKCINDNPIKTTSLIFVVNLHREMLNAKYDVEEVFVMTSSMLRSLARDEATYDLFMRSLMEYMKACHECVEFSKNDPDFDVIDVLTKVYFSLVIDDREYLMEELEDSIPQSVSFRKIYNYIYGIINHSVIHKENNRPYLRRTLDIK